MNKYVVLIHLKKALEELQRTVHALEQGNSYDRENLEVAMGHLYHHLNTAWNGQNQSDEQFRKCSEEDFARFRKFPSESEFMYLAS